MQEGLIKYNAGDPKAKLLYEAAFGKKGKIPITTRSAIL
jgi:hypothetical protein